MQSGRGFSLIELLIVVAIILIIATIAIPSLLRSRIAANESSAVATLRSMHTSLTTYSTGTGGLFPLNLTQLVSEDLMDSRFIAGTGASTGAISGYTYTLTTSGAQDEYTVVAAATGSNAGRCVFTITGDSTVRVHPTQTVAGATCPRTAGGPVE